MAKHVTEATKVPKGTAKEAAEKPIGDVPLIGCRCRCGHEWLPREDERPRVCPKCKSANWDRPKRWTNKKAGAGGD